MRVGLKVTNYKCFRGGVEGFDDLRPVNVIIGRNNAGKSALLELLEMAIPGRDKFGDGPELHFRRKVTQHIVNMGFAANANGGEISGNHGEFGSRFIGGDLSWRLGAGGVEVTGYPGEGANTAPIAWRGIATELSKVSSSRRLFRLAAARDIVPEAQVPPRSLGWRGDGTGVTNLIVTYLNVLPFRTAAVKDALLADLNRIMAPLKFTDIAVQQEENLQKWEVCLSEDGKDSIPLSASGAGLKTVITVLALLHMRLQLDGVTVGQCDFALEELENNLHPALQRQLLFYLRERAVNDGARFFLTTHSSIAIDVFANDDKASIVHVTHDGARATVRTVATRALHRGILNDIDARASDLLQSNCIVWLEGPSDRRYFNRWIDLWTGGKVREGAHYQCVFYGGVLLAHLTASDDTEAANAFIDVLSVNRNAIVMMDSDKGAEGDSINATKKRVSAETQACGGLAWVSVGREVENYLPLAALRALGAVEDLSGYDKFSEIADIVAQSPQLVALWKNGKVAFAEAICPHITRESIAGHLDLAERLNATVAQICRWNSINIPKTGGEV